MKKLTLVLFALGTCALVACGGDNPSNPTPDSGTPDGGTDGGTFTQPAGTVPVNFTVDDSKNKVYKLGDLEWKGAMKFDPTTRLVTKDSNWSGPYAKLYDDGPWSAGGHEPAGAVAGDNKWGVTIFATPPATGTDSYEYGLNDTTACAPSSTCVNGNGWSWLGANGSFSVAAGATAAITAAGRSFPAFGTYDVKVTAKKSALDSYCALSAPATCTQDSDCNNANYKCVTVGSAKQCALKQRQKCTGGVSCPSGSGADAQTCTAPDTSKVTFKSSMTSWSEVLVTDDGTGNFVFTLSKTVGAGNAIPHAGLVSNGDTPEFLFVLNGVEYRDYSAVGTPANTAGITAQAKNGAAAFGYVSIGTASNGNTNVAVADPFVQPTGTVAVNFSVDDSKNKIYQFGDLEWKGAMKYDPTTRTVTKDSNWSGPYAKLYDDGPWDTGGHEPPGAVAGDHKWGVTVFATPPATGTDSYEYGLNDTTACAPSSTCVNGNGWSWLGANGSYSVAAGATAPINAAGRTFPAFGSTDVVITAKKSGLDSYCALSAPATCTQDSDCNNANYKCVTVGTAKQCALKVAQKCTGGVACPAGTGTDAQSCKAPDTSKVTFKSSMLAWSEVLVVDDGSGNFVFTLSKTVGTGNAIPHAGLVSSGDTPEFLFVLNGVEYRDYAATGSPANMAGLTASTKPSGGSAAAATISTATNGNTTITIP
jgi:hypothetical protein